MRAGQEGSDGRKEKSQREDAPAGREATWRLELGKSRAAASAGTRMQPPSPYLGLSWATGKFQGSL